MTLPDSADWHETEGFRRFTRTVAIGAGDAVWRQARADLLTWQVKTRSGFRVVPATGVVAGARFSIEVPLGLMVVREPIEVVTVIDRPDRVGYAYRTLPGHPIEGEEAFILTRTGEQVKLTIRSLSRPASSFGWRLAYPLVRVAPAIARRRYLASLRLRRSGRSTRAQDDATDLLA